MFVPLKWCVDSPQMTLIIHCSRNMVIFYTVEWWQIIVTQVTKKSFPNPSKLYHLRILLVTIFTNVWGLCPSIFLAIQSNKCIPHFNTNTTNCTKMMGKYKDLRVMDIRNFLRAHQAYQKKNSFNLWGWPSTLVMRIYKLCELPGPSEYDSVENTPKFERDKCPVPNNQITHSLG
jgi:hypothetical protein